MSTTHEIPHAEWRSFLDHFSSMHEGWLVTVEIVEEEAAGIEARNLALEGVVADVRRGGDEISILVGPTLDVTLAHHIHAPEHVYLKQSDEGADETLCVVSREGSKTLLTFRSPLRPDVVDGTPA
jgi:hypothetical protein